MLELQRLAGNAAVVRLRGSSACSGPPSAAAQTSGGLADFLPGLQVAKGMLDTALNVMLGEPLTAAEMRELLLIRRAQPLSIPASVVNTAAAQIAEIDSQIAATDRAAQQAAPELAAAAVLRGGTRPARSRTPVHPSGEQSSTATGWSA
jgi:hypothetical protein